MSAIRVPVQYHIFRPAALAEAFKRLQIGELFRLAALRRESKHIILAIILPGEGNPLTIWREFGHQLHAGMSGEFSGGSAVSIDRPEITAVHKDHLVSMDIRKSKQPSLFRGLQRKGHEEY
ncbi:MAG: hypothetical protein MAGBODY4_01698 [Candidatus Marinimicrobia bacterium]|nr:hypothetical protein [Candidatus Neomarinimicrobiota bacterium]